MNKIHELLTLSCITFASCQVSKPVKDATSDYVVDPLKKHQVQSLPQLVQVQLGLPLEQILLKSQPSRQSSQQTSIHEKLLVKIFVNVCLSLKSQDGTTWVP